MSGLCRHFGSCGGCAFQDISRDSYREMKRARIANLLKRHDFDGPVATLSEIAPGTRRRATLKAEKRDGTVVLGFNARRSHAIVDLCECLVLTPNLVSLVPEIRELLRRLLDDGEDAGVNMTETDTGLDMGLMSPARSVTRKMAVLAQWAERRAVARISLNGEPAVQFAPPRIRLGDADVLLPADCFLQPSREGERVLQDLVLDFLKGARCVADLFAGCGTFTLALARRASVHAVDSDVQALEALNTAARKTKGLKPVTTERRDLFKLPLQANELNRFDAVVIDPPRAGARAQAGMIGQSRAERVAYVSCNPESFARDAAVLKDNGFDLAGVKPVDQFLWSTHIELLGILERRSGWSRRHKS